MTKQPSGETLSGPILRALQDTYPEVKTGRWRRAVFRALRWHARRSGSPRDFMEMLTAVRMLPDAYAIDVAAKSVTFFEVEVYNPMRDAKMMAYGRLALDLDYYGIAFAVLVVNKYGHINEVPVYRHYAERVEQLMAQEPRSAATRRVDARCCAPHALTAHRACFVPKSHAHFYG